MGGGLALHFLRRNLSEKIRGIFTMGSFLVESSAVLTDSLPEKNLDLPVIMMHGEYT